MPVNTRHPDYRLTLPQWVRCRDTFAGSDAVKAKGTAYLPLLEGHGTTNSTGYIGYLARALFYPAVGRTTAGLAGLVFAKLPTVKGVPKAAQPSFEDVTLTGTSLGAYGMHLCIEDLVTGRVGTLIDMPDNAPTNSPRPYWVSYTAEQIVNWRVERINGKLKPVLIVLEEQDEQTKSGDPFDIETKTQYRVLELKDSVYTVTVYTQDTNDKTKFIAGTPRIPLRRGQPLDFIPFTCLTANDVGFDITPPPLLPLVDVNLSHYRTSADHEHGAHFTALPTPYITGHKMPPGEILTIGSGNAWVLDEKATAGMLEFSGAGLGSLAALKEEKRQLMATLGARMLETDKNTAEAAMTVRLRHAGEASAMSVLADALGQSMTQSMRWHLWWSGMEDEQAAKASVSMNPEVMEELSSDDARALVEMWQKDAISKETLYYNLQWGEWTRPGVTFAEEEATIKKEKESDDPPTPPPVPPPQPGTPPQPPQPPPATE
jgi:hypothetical protein